MIEATLFLAAMNGDTHVVNDDHTLRSLNNVILAFDVTPRYRFERCQKAGVIYMLWTKRVIASVR